MSNKNIIEQYTDLFNEFYKWKEKANQILNNPDLEKQANQLPEDHEMYGMVFTNLQDWLRQEAD
jgi:hypothetical protein